MNPPNGNPQVKLNCFDPCQCFFASLFCLLANKQPVNNSTLGAVDTIWDESLGSVVFVMLCCYATTSCMLAASATLPSEKGIQAKVFVKNFPTVDDCQRRLFVANVNFKIYNQTLQSSVDKETEALICDLISSIWQLSGNCASHSIHQRSLIELLTGQLWRLELNHSTHEHSFAT